MNKSIFIVIAAVLVVSSSLAVAASDSSANYGLNASYRPADLIGSAYLGTVTINTDGTVSNPSVISHSGESYTLTSDINGSVTDLRNNSVLNGNGYTINGNGSVALTASNVTGLTVENIIIVNSSVGVYLTSVSNVMLNNDTLNGTSGVNAYLVEIYFSDNVTVENSNFSLNSTATATYGVYAYSDTSVNVSSNLFSGPTVDYFVFAEYLGSFSAWYNTINSTDSSAYAFYVENGAYATFGYNYMNYTDEGIYAYWENSVTTMYNQIYNTSTGLDIEYVTTFVSSHDAASLSSSYALYLYYVGNGLAQFDNLSSSGYGTYVEYSQNITIADSNLSNASSEGVYVEYSVSINVVNDQINLSEHSVYAVYAYYVPGGVNLKGDSIYTPNTYGLYLYYSPYFNVTDSYVYAKYNIYVESSILGANVMNNTFVTTNGYDTVYMDGYYYLYNFVFSNNTVTSPSTTPVDYGLYLYVYYGSTNIVVKGNTFVNSDYPIYLYSDYENAANVWIQNNIFINSTDTIYIEYYGNVHITGNTIQNVSSYGIYAYSDYIGSVDVSNNTVYNLPGFGAFEYGIYVDDYYYGSNIISRNTVFGGGSTSTGIYAYDNLNLLFFDNNVNNSKYALYLQANNGVTAFNNVASNSNEGFYSYENINVTYYSNTFINNNYSLDTEYDYGGNIFANTFLDNQSGLTYTQDFLYVYYPYGQLTFYHNNFLNETTGTNVTNYVKYTYLNGPVYMNEPLPVGGNYWSNYTGHGTDGIGNTPMPVYGSLLDYYPLTSRWTNPTVTFVETGLPAGTAWSVSLGSSIQSSTSGSIVYSPTNGQYANESYTVSHVSGYVASVTSGSVYLNGASNVVTVTFTPYTYAVSFTESNLPSGTSWSVTLNGVTESTATSTIAFSEPNGTYSYSIGSVTGYFTSTTSGTVNVSSGVESISVSFSQSTYTLTVTQVGLPSGDTWTFTLGGVQHTSNSSTLTVQVTSGTHSVSASGPSGYSVSVASNVTVNNAAASLTVTFTQNKTSTSSTGTLLGGIGIGALIGVVATVFGMMFYTGTGVFTNIRKGKGESP